MDVAIMPFVPEVPAAPAAAPQKGAGKAASPGEDSGGFAAVLSSLVPAEQPASDDRETTTGGEMAPAMWNFLPLMTLVATTGQATVPQTTQVATGTTGAITALTAAGRQTAPVTPMAPPVTALTTDAAQQQAAKGAAPGAQPTLVTTAAPQLPGFATTDQATAAVPTAPVMTAAQPPATPVATMPDVQAAAVPMAIAVPITVEAGADMATAPATAAQQPVTPTAIAAAVVSAPRLPDKPAPTPVVAAQADAAAPDQIPQSTTAAVVTASSEASATGDDGSALTAESFASAEPKAAPPPETATVNQAFAALVDQAANPAAATARSSEPVMPTAPGPDPHNVAGQIVDTARLITRAENSEMVIKLKPEHLGELTLKIVVDSGAVSATFHTSSAEVRAAIEASLPQLKQDMANQGLKVDNVGVYASLDHFSANDQRHAPQQQVPQTVRRQSGDEVFADTVQAATALGSMTAGGVGIDYRV